jgi:lipoate-protein ligase A
MNSWLLLNSGACPPAINMALDEALLEAVARLDRPVLRFYGWTEPAATFGYFQKYAGVECATRLRPLIRRPTGGGIVPHDADWTYSLIFPPGHEWHALKAEASYRRVHEWIQRAFAKLHVATDLAPGCKKSVPGVCGSRREEAHIEKSEIGNRKSEISQSLLTSAATPALPGQCFTGHEKLDLLWHGKKIAGAAQRRNQLGLLIQGSVQPIMVGTSRCDVPARAAAGGTIAPLPSSLRFDAMGNAARTAQRTIPTRADWQKAMTDAGRVEFGVAWSDFEPDPALRERAESLARQKYSQPEFIARR